MYALKSHVLNRDRPIVKSIRGLRVTALFNVCKRSVIAPYFWVVRAMAGTYGMVQISPGS